MSHDAYLVLASVFIAFNQSIFLPTCLPKLEVEIYFTEFLFKILDERGIIYMREGQGLKQCLELPCIDLCTR